MAAEKEDFRQLMWLYKIMLEITMDRACKQWGHCKENGRKMENYTLNQKETVETSAT